MTVLPVASLASRNDCAGSCGGSSVPFCLRLFFCVLRFRRFCFRACRSGLGVQQTAHFVHAALRVARQLIEVAGLPIQAALHVGIRFFDAVQKILGVFLRRGFRAAAHVQLSAGENSASKCCQYRFSPKIPFSGKALPRFNRCDDVFHQSAVRHFIFVLRDTHAFQFAAEKDLRVAADACVVPQERAEACTLCVPVSLINSPTFCVLMPPPGRISMRSLRIRSSFHSLCALYRAFALAARQNARSPRLIRSSECFKTSAPRQWHGGTQSRRSG